MATKKGKTVKAKAMITATASVKTELEKVGKQNAKNAKNGVKQFYTDNGAKLLIATMATISGTGTKIIPTELRKATKNNAQARRQWCMDNKMPKLNWLAIQKIDGIKNGKATPALRPDNSIRARVFSQRENLTIAKKVGYIRVLDDYTAKKNPTHPDCQAVYVYRIA
jgi:hypothetical protein